MGVKKMAYNRPNPIVHRWLIPMRPLWHAVYPMLTGLTPFLPSFLCNYRVNHARGGPDPVCSIITNVKNPEY